MLKRPAKLGRGIMRESARADNHLDFNRVIACAGYDVGAKSPARFKADRKR
jgi:hypothetical protein